jgi:plastocyanin
MRKAIMITAGMALSASSIAVGASAYASSSAAKGVTVQIVGTNILRVNDSIKTTYRFPDTIRVHQGELITFNNRTVEAHTVALVRAADLPTTVAGVFNCALCNTVNSIFSPSGGPGLPAGVQIDNGKITDDESDADADVTDPNVPSGVPLPFPVLVQDFNVSAHSGPGGSMTVGDATLVPSTVDHVGFTARTVKVTADPGTYHYFCTFHAWMQGTLIVTS